MINYSVDNKSINQKIPDNFLSLGTCYILYIVRKKYGNMDYICSMYIARYKSG